MRRLSSFRDFDWVLLGFVLLLSVISVLEIKSATLMTKFRGFDHKQIEFLLVGVVLMFLMSLIDYHRLIDIAPYAYGIGVVSLVAVKLVGQKVLGARRWIRIGSFHFQPSEWIKLILIIAVARYFWEHRGQGTELAGYREGLRAGVRPDGAGADPAGPGDLADLSADAARAGCCWVGCG